MSDQGPWLNEPGVQVACEDGADLRVFGSWALAIDYVETLGVPGLQADYQSFGGPPRGIIWLDAAGERRFIAYSHDLNA